jgi:ABC-type arginine transport system ATPase subunit
MPFGTINEKKQDAFKPDNKNYLVDNIKRRQKTTMDTQTIPTKAATITPKLKKNVVYTCNITIAQETLDSLFLKAKNEDRSVSYIIARAVEKYLS